MEKINHPSHYGGDTLYEVIKVIEAWDLGFALGNCVKYIARAGKKLQTAPLEDLRKARWYLDREIAKYEKLESSARPAVLRESGTPSAGAGGREDGGIAPGAHVLGGGRLTGD